jgi:hypothetical protein
MEFNLEHNYHFCSWLFHTITGSQISIFRKKLFSIFPFSMDPKELRWMGNFWTNKLLCYAMITSIMNCKLKCIIICIITCILTHIRIWKSTRTMTGGGGAHRVGAGRGWRRWERAGRHMGGGTLPYLLLAVYPSVCGLGLWLSFSCKSIYWFLVISFTLGPSGPNNF